MNEPLISSAGAVGGRAEAGTVGDGAWLGGTSDVHSMFQRYRGSVPVEEGRYPLARAEDPDHRKPVYRMIVHAKVFNLEDVDDVDEYTSVIQQCTDQEDGARIVALQVEKPSEGYPRWSAFVQWVTGKILPPNQQGSEKHRPMNTRRKSNEQGEGS